VNKEKTTEGTKSAQNQEKAIQQRIFIGVSIDTQLWRRLQAQAIKMDINSGPLLDRAIEEFLLMNE